MSTTSRTLPLVVFALAAVAQCVAPLAGVIGRERVARHGTSFRVRCDAPDPYDPFRGRFLAVRPEQTTVAAPAGMPVGEIVTAWGVLAVGDDGLARIERLELAPSAGANVIRVRAVRHAGDRAQVRWPFDRFYLNERLAPEADAVVARAVRERRGPVGSVAATAALPVAEFRLLDGRAVLVDVLLDGVSVRDLAKQGGR